MSKDRSPVCVPSRDGSTHPERWIAAHSTQISYREHGRRSKLDVCVWGLDRVHLEMLARLRFYDASRLFAQNNISCLTENDRRREYEISFKSVEVNRECQVAKISVSVASPSEVVRKSIPCGGKIIDDRFQVSIQGLTKRSIIQEHGFCLRHSDSVCRPSP